MECGRWVISISYPLHFDDSFSFESLVFSKPKLKIDETTLPSGSSTTINKSPN